MGWQSRHRLQLCFMFQPAFPMSVTTLLLISIKDPGVAHTAIAALLCGASQYCLSVTITDSAAFSHAACLMIVASYQYRFCPKLIILHWIACAARHCQRMLLHGICAA
eukprot:GHRR01024029.1.p1 GENE.GHRR01024029.1~~GHRR01024029.1.p1  ORF type:complete len:108 (-),score=14.49 GHRR01024029.1:103-426(-)